MYMYIVCDSICFIRQIVVHMHRSIKTFLSRLWYLHAYKHAVLFCRPVVASKVLSLYRYDGEVLDEHQKSLATYIIGNETPKVMYCAVCVCVYVIV